MRQKKSLMLSSLHLTNLREIDKTNVRERIHMLLLLCVGWLPSAREFTGEIQTLRLVFIA